MDLNNNNNWILNDIQNNGHYLRPVLENSKSTKIFALIVWIVENYIIERVIKLYFYWMQLIESINNEKGTFHIKE